MVIWRITLTNWGANTKGHQNNYITDQKRHNYYQLLSIIITKGNQNSYITAQKKRNYYQFLQKSSPQIPDQQDHVWTEGKVEKKIINKKLMKSKHLKGQLWPRVCDEKCLWRFCLFLPSPPPRSVVTHPPSRFCLFLPNCILAWRSSLGPPPGGRHRT